jgi:large subunit ribosomal protein L5e
MEEIYTNAYSAIREDPTFKPTEKGDKDWKAESLKHRTPRLTHSQRKDNIEQKIQLFKAGQAAGDEDDE